MATVTHNLRNFIIRYTAVKKLFFGLPSEVIARIFDFDDQISSTVVQNSLLRGTSDMNILYASMPIAISNIDLKYFEYFTPKMCTFVVDSHDQGWTSQERTNRRDSYSWGEVSFSCPVLEVGNNTSTRCEVYRNMRACSNWDEQIVEFNKSSNLLVLLIQLLEQLRLLSVVTENFDEFVNNDEPLLTLQLWIRSCYPGWTNTIRFASITIVWEISDALHTESFENLTYLVSMNNDN